MDEELLIDTVREYPHLYDQASKYYHDSSRKENAWEERGKILHCTCLLYVRLLYY